jgi:hypothetical protein
MNNTRSIVMMVFVVAVTFSAAILHGRWTNRWGSPTALGEAANVFARLPSEFGGWHKLKSEELTANVRGILQCQDYVQAVYENQQTSEQVLLTLLLGPPGPMSVHTPEICYASVDSVEIGSRKRVQLPPESSENSAWMVQFREAHQPAQGITRVYYTWGDGLSWNAVEEPRITYGGSPYLFKMQVRVPLPEGAEKESSDSARSFIAALVPAFAEAAAPLRPENSP